MKKYYRQIIFLLLATFSICLTHATTLAMNYQASLTWSEPINLSGTENQSNSPLIAADKAGNIHIVWSEVIEDGRSFIVYTTLSNGTWSKPIEITTSLLNEMALSPSIGADSLGYLHLTWLGDGNIYYSRAYSTLATSAQNWLKPRTLEYYQNNVGAPNMIIGPNDYIHVVYAITIGSNSGIYYLHSENRGQNWSDPVTIYKNMRTDRMVSDPKIATGENGKLHVVWVESEYPITFPPIGIRYSTSQSDNSNIWSESITIADGPYNYPSIQAMEKEVHITWSGTQPDRFRFHRWSADNGKTWSDLWRNLEIGGYQGNASMVMDSRQRLNWITAAGVYKNESDAIVYLSWSEGNWSPIEIAIERTENIGQNIRDVSAVIALGNKLYVVFSYPLASKQQPEGWQNEIYCLSSDLDAPGIGATQISLPTNTSTAFPPTITPHATARLLLDTSLRNEAPASSNSMLLVIVIGVLVGLGVVLLGAIYIRHRQ